MRRRLALLLPILGCGPLAGCVPSTVSQLATGFGADVAIFHRTLPDMIYSAVSGRDCSVVRLDRNESYCKPIDPPVPPQPYCTRTLARVECWQTPTPTEAALLPPTVAQGPNTLTPDQNRLRLARWPTALQ